MLQMPEISPILIRIWMRDKMSSTLLPKLTTSVLKDQRAVNSQKGYLPILSQNPPPYIISFKMPTMKTGVRGQNITKEFCNASESWLKIQFLRSSDIAEGMQCVARISSVAAFEVFVRRTTTCMVEYSSKHKWAARCAFINNHIREMRERGGEREKRPDRILDQISKIRHHNSLPCLPNSSDSSQDYH